MSDTDERLANLERQVQALEHQVAKLKELFPAEIEAAWKQRIESILPLIRRPRLDNDEALKTFDALKRDDPSLTLPDFAAQFGLSANALRQARSRRRKKR